MKVIIKDYLERLRATETLHPSGREVPNLTELADSIEVSFPTLSRFANNRMQRLDTEMVNKIVNELRDRGFDTYESDILELGKNQPAEVLVVG